MTGLRESAWAEDGTIEAVEDPSHRFALGVLWHPEEGEDYALFAALVEEAAAYRLRADGLPENVSTGQFRRIPGRPGF